MNQKSKKLAMKAFFPGTYSVKTLDNLTRNWQIIALKSLFLSFFVKISVFPCGKPQIPPGTYSVIPGTYSVKSPGTYSVKNHPSSPIYSRVFAIGSTIMFFLKYLCNKYNSKTCGKLKTKTLPLSLFFWNLIL